MDLTKLLQTTIWTSSLMGGKAEIIFGDNDEVIIGSDKLTFAIYLNEDNFPILEILKEGNLLYKFKWHPTYKCFKSRAYSKKGVDQLTPMSNIPYWTELSKPSRAQGKKPRMVGSTLRTGLKYFEVEEINFTDKYPEGLPEERSKTALCFIACNRPHYFAATLTGVVTALANYTGNKMDAFLFLDYPLDKSQAQLEGSKLQVAQFKAAFPDGYVIDYSRNIGCGANAILARFMLFDSLKYEAAYIFEDDMVPNSNYFRVCEDLSKVADSTDTFGVVQGWNWFSLSTPAADYYADYYTPVISNLWGYKITKKCWDKISTFMHDYYNLFIRKTIYSNRDHQEIIAYFRDKLKGVVISEIPIFGEAIPDYRAKARKYFTSPPSGQDAATNVGLMLAGQIRLGPVVPRGTYIGREGIHMNPTWWRRDGYDSLKSLSEVPDSWVELLDPVVEIVDRTTDLPGMLKAV